MPATPTSHGRTDLRRTDLRRFDFLDLLRGLAAVSVVAEHTAEICVPGFRNTIQYFAFGPLLLPLFMLISGFVIPISLERGGSIQRFWIGRLFRLYPLYWANLACLALLFWAWPSLGAFDTKTWLANITMLQEFLRQPNINPVVWTLTLELVFYGLCTLLFATGLLRRSLLIAWLGILAFAVAGIGVPVLLHRHFPAGRAFLFLSAFLGMVFHRLHTGDVSPRQVAGLLAGLFVPAAAVCYINFEMYRHEDGYTFVSVFVPWLLAFAIFAGLFAIRHRPMPRGLVGLGTISYSIYLMHPLVLKLVPSNLPGPVFALAVAASMAIIAPITYVLIERPSLRLGQSLAKRRVAEPEVPPEMKRAA